MDMRYCPKCKKFIPHYELKKDKYHNCGCRTVPGWSEAKRLQVENERLKQFVRYIIKAKCWALFDDIDGGTVQEKAEELGLIEPVIATESDVSEFSDFEVGDKIYNFTEILKED